MAAMAIRRLTVPKDTPPRLDAFLARALPALGKPGIQRLLEQGRVRVDGTKAKPLRRVRGGETVELDLPPPRAVPPVEGPRLEVLYEDAALVVVNKPAGVVVEPEGKQPSIVGLAATQLTGFDVGGLAAPGVAHRLDRNTTGCLALAKTDEALAALQRAFEEKRTDKTYLALVGGAPPDTGSFDTPYARDPGDPRRYTTRVESPRRARLSFKTLERFEAPAALVEVTLDTGRTHQIRVQLSEAGFPVLGDDLYGGHAADQLVPRLALHATHLRIEGMGVDVRAPLPRDLEEARRALSRPRTT